MVFKDPFTNTHRQINAAMDTVNDFDLFNWERYLYSTINNISQQKSGKLDTKHINQVIQEYTTNISQTEDFKNSISGLFALSISIIEQHHFSAGITGLLRVQNLFFETVSHEAQNFSMENASSQSSTPDCNIRYVSGMCVGRILYSASEYVCRNIHVDNNKLREKKELVCVLKKHLYNTLHIAGSESQFPQTLTEISHRQYKFGHLTIVDDHLSLIFKEFDRLLIPNLTAAKLNHHYGDMFGVLLNCTMDTMFTEGNVTIPEDLTWRILKPILAKYLRVCLKELGLRITSDLNVKKKLAHRKQVLLEESHQGKVPKGDLQQQTSTSHIQPSTPPYLKSQSANQLTYRTFQVAHMLMMQNPALQMMMRGNGFVPFVECAGPLADSTGLSAPNANDGFIENVTAR